MNFYKETMKVNTMVDRFGNMYSGSFLKLSLVLFLFFTSIGHSHGEDKLGPNGGYIRMPGAFHTEVVMDGSNKMRVYLLDMNWKNSSVKDSALEVTVMQSNQTNKGICVIVDNYYSCELPEGFNLKPGTMKVKAQRKKLKGTAVYELPLQLKKIEKTEKNHGGHH
jgi:hypothetical protein